MKYLKNINTILIIIFLIAGYSCSKTEENLVLDKDYITVSDLSRYCTGSCNEIGDWENKKALVKGYLKGAENDSILQEFYDKNLFYLDDIRTGLFLEIRITDDRDAIFNKLYSVQKMDMFYIKGIATPVTAYDGDKCTKGMVLTVDNADSVDFGDD